MESRSRRSPKRWMMRSPTLKVRKRKALRYPHRHFRLHGAISRSRQKPARESRRPSVGRQTFSTPAELNEDQATEAGTPPVPASIICERINADVVLGHRDSI